MVEREGVTEQQNEKQENQFTSQREEEDEK